MFNLFSTISTKLGWLATHQGFRRYFLNTFWIFAEKGLRIIAVLFVGVYVARYLGPEQFGLYSYALAFVALFSTITKLGLDSIVVRDLIHHPLEVRHLYLGTAFWLKLIGAAVTLVLLAFAVQLTSNDATTNLYILIIASGLIFQSFEVIDFYFQAKVLSKYVSICKLVQLVLSSALKLYLVFLHADLIWFVLISLIDQITLALSLAYAYWRQQVRSFFGQFDLSIAKELLKNSWPLILSSAAISLYMRIDQVMIKEMLGEKDVGLYSAAIQLSEAWYFIPTIITASVFPAIVNARKISQSLYHQRLQRLITVMTWMGIVVALLMTFLGDWLIVMLYGSAYQAAGSVLSIHIWAAVFVFMGVATGVFFTVENLTQKVLYRTVLGVISNVLLNIIFIPRYGINGAAMASVLSQFIVNYFYDLFDRSTRILLITKTKALLPVYYVWKRHE